MLEDQAGAAVAKGTILDGRYELVRCLGVGGMGEVWLARTIALDREVAVKLVRGLRTKSATERLLREARIAARIRHESIVQVFDVATTPAGAPYLVMELLHGIDLGVRLEREQRVEVVEAVRLLASIAGALGAAHEHGVVHRDVKPDNVFLAESRSGIEPKILDFGIARIQLPESAPKLTAAGTVLGTPQYMAPEQVQGDDVDARADVWALGVTLYETIAGHLPFPSADAARMFEDIVASPPAFPTHVHALDGKLWAIITKALRKDPAERFANGAEIGAALVAWLHARGVTSSTNGRELASLLPSSASAASPLSAAASSVPAHASPASDGRRADQHALTLDAAIFSSLGEKR